MAKLEYVYVGSLWHQYCDPFVTIAAKIEVVAQRELDAAAKTEWADMDVVFECDIHLLIDECKCKPEYDIMTGGIFKELVAGTSLTTKELAEIEADGYCYLER